MRTFPNRKWLVIPAELVETIDFSEVLQASAETLRYSLDRTKTFVKYEVSVVEETYTKTFINAETGEPDSYVVEAGVYGRPSFWSENYPEYTHEEILSVLLTPEWTDPNPTIE
jgi:hypothetical protein